MSCVHVTKCLNLQHYLHGTFMLFWQDYTYTSLYYVKLLHIYPRYNTFELFNDDISVSGDLEALVQ